MELIMPILIWGGVIFGVLLFLALLFNAFYKKIPQGYAMIVNDMSAKPKVFFTGGFVLPVVHKMEVMKISLITLELDRRAKDGLICKDNLRADINVAFYLRVNETQDDVLKVAKAIGVDRASDREAVNELFNAKFSEALKTVGKKMNFLELFENRIQFREQIIEVIGQDLNGYVLEDVAIDYLEQTPKSELDPFNILDSEGIRRITEVTATQSIETNRLEKDQALAINKKNVETREALLALERQEADAVARQKREVETLKAREEAETLKVQQEERLKSEEARIRTEEEIAVQDVNKNRQVEIANKAKERALAIEEEKVVKARELEAVNREREVELQRIDKEKALEEERKIIANTVSERIAVEKKVAEEEERIKEVREISEADRLKQVRIMEAEATSEEEKIKQVKAAEAEEQQAVHKAKEIQLMAQAELEASSKQAEAAKKKAEGDQATHAASGLAAAKVQAAKAEALEKEGQAEARVIEAQAIAREKEGLMQAKVLEERLNAEANGLREQGLAEAEASRQKGLAEAEASREKGLADSAVIRERANAEADGLTAKFNAMNNMSTEAREFEEFKMRLEAALTEVQAKLDANKEISKDQASIMASAFENSNIDIIGGDGDYFNKMASGMGMGKAIDGLLTESPMLQQIMQRFMTAGKTPAPADKVN
ncbi:hypothetical protein [Reinekea blandensis]|uniref:Band 7 domain-containing protein n=1 Tax=Reinekea blandensis MED297 TaxID=314283 RepID=A4BJ73_9GAMM|nr:hypothetical protein [Reinekea blandensis]EAR07826.1 hypothetical protein MED297_05259 [Reinekea sp. MED297] [Reinekea blandensis MED297]